MINAILKGLFKLVISLVSIVLYPIDVIINAAFPSISSALSYIATMFQYVESFFSYILSWLHLPDALITLIVGYTVFRLTIPFAVHTTKLAVKWYHMLMP